MTVAALFVVGLLIGAALVYVAKPSSTSSSTSTSTTSSTGLPPVVNIGMLNDFTDGLSSIGIRINASANQATTDINNWVQTTAWAGKVTFHVVPLDYALDSTKALTDMNTFKSQGITVVVGPLNSGTAGALLQFANSNQMVLISPSSTSPALAIANDYLFRTAPTDVHQGAADARMMWQSGAKAIIIVYRQDSYGTGLDNYTKARFAALGGTVAAEIPYDTTTTNFAPVVAEIASAWTAASAKYGANSVAIDEIAFEELGPLLLAAKTANSPILSTPLPWFGDDGIADDNVITNSTYASVVSQIRLPSTIFGYTNSSKTAALCSEILTATHQTCESYSLGSYDDVWLAALSILNCGTTAGSCVQKEISTVAANYYGVTGWTLLDANGDRAAGDFLVWCVTGAGNAASWNLCGSWSAASDSVTWTAKPSGVA